MEAQEWHSAVSMYRSNELWDDAIRVAKFHGGIVACKRVTIALLMAIGVVRNIQIFISYRHLYFCLFLLTRWKERNI